MVQPRPQADFFSQEENSKAFRQIVRTSMFQSAITHSLAAFALSGPSQEQLSGANTFLRVFLNLAEPPEERGQFPDKSAALYAPPKAEPKK